MCNPAVIPAVIALAGAGVAAYGQHQTGQYQRAIADQNAQLAEQSAIDASRRGAIEEEQHRARVRAILGAQRAAFGASNVVSSSGSPLGLLADTAQFGEADALTIRNNAAREVFGYRTEGQGARLRSRMYGRGARYEAGGTLLAGGAQAYGYWRTRN